MRIVLASASPARAGLLRNAGISASVVVSGVDEDAVATALDPAVRADPAALTLALAQAKCAAVTSSLVADDPDGPQTLVIAADSLLEVNGVGLGKPRDADDAVARWRAMRGCTGVLHTGHALALLPGPVVVAATASTTVRFGRPDDGEIDAYVATGEPLSVAGAFTLDGRSAAFIDGIDGDPGNVIGLSLPLMRRLCAELGLRWVSLWNPL